MIRAQIEKSQWQFRQLFEAVGVPVRLLDRDRQVLADPAALPMLNHSNLNDTPFAPLFQEANPYPVFQRVGEVEVYAAFPLALGEGFPVLFVLIGPTLLFSPWEEAEQRKLTFAGGASKTELDELIAVLPPLPLRSFGALVRYIFGVISSRQVSWEDMGWPAFCQALGETIDQQVKAKTFLDREAPESLSGYQRERMLMEYIRTGDAQRLENLHYGGFSLAGRMLALTEEKRRLCGFAILSAICASSAVQGGLPMEMAFALCEVYIQQADTVPQEALGSLSSHMMLDFARRTRQYKRPYSAAIRRVLEHISSHLHESLPLAELAGAAGLSPRYLCTLFKKETGRSLTDYIQSQRVEEARNLLKFSDYSTAEISSYLNFSSQSYFIRVFKRHTGMTPMQFRAAYHESRWQ